MRKSKNRGFTLIEMLVVISIIAILASMVAGTISVVRNRAKAALARTDIQGLYNAFEQFKLKYGAYPDWKDTTLFGLDFFNMPTGTDHGTYQAEFGKRTLTKKLIDRLMKDKFFSFEYAQMDTEKNRGTSDKTKLCLNDPYGLPYVVQTCKKVNSAVNVSDSGSTSITANMPNIIGFADNGVFIYSTGGQLYKSDGKNFLASGGQNKDCVYLKSE